MPETGFQSIINPNVVKKSDQICRQFISADPFPHVVIDDFLQTRFARQLLDQFPSFEQGNARSDDGSLGGKSTLDKVRGIGSAYRKLDDAIKSPGFLNAVSALTGIDDLLYDPWYLGGGTHENRPGMSLDPHVDFNYHPSERWHRRLNMLVYLNPVWKPEWGGCLELFSDPSSDACPTRTIVPTFGRCVIFETSERSWHGFNTIQIPEDRPAMTRRSIALYFYTRERPENEITNRHTTYYVNRKLPAHIKEGAVLTEVDVAGIKQLLEQRDEHIRRLYAENTNLRKAQDSGLRGHLLYLAKRAYVRFRR